MNLCAEIMQYETKTKKTNQIMYTSDNRRVSHETNCISARRKAIEIETKHEFRMYECRIGLSHKRKS